MKSFFLALTPILALFSCAHRGEEAGGGPRGPNVYEEAFRAAPTDMQAKLGASAFNLLRGTQATFIARLGRDTRTELLDRAFPRGPVHGDLHLEQAVWMDKGARLSDFDKSDEAPFFLDLLRMESAAQVFAFHAGLRGYQEGACWDSYMDSVGSTHRGEKVNPVGPPFSPTREQTSPFANWTVHPLWTKSGPVDLGSVKMRALRDWLGSIGIDPAEIRSSRSGVGSFLMEKYVVLTRDSRLWELKEQEKAPLGRWSPKRSGSDTVSPACERVDFAWKAFEPERKRHCWSFEKKSYNFVPLSLTYWSPEEEDYKNPAQLQAHVRWICSQLWKTQWKSLDRSQIQQIYMLSRGHPLVRERLLGLANEDAKLLMIAFRSIQKSVPKSD